MSDIEDFRNDNYSRVALLHNNNVTSIKLCLLVNSRQKAEARLNVKVLLNKQNYQICEINHKKRLVYRKNRCHFINYEEIC